MPRSRRRCLQYKGVELPDKRRARNLARAEASEMRGRHLAVDHAEVRPLQLRDQRHQCDLRGVGHAREHRLAEKHAPDRDAV